MSGVGPQQALCYEMRFNELRKLVPAFMLILGLSISVLCNVQPPESECDFSSYKPLVVSHPLVNAEVKKVEPEYPKIARAARAQGDVKVKILVDRTGNVAYACVVDGHPLLQAAARKAALGWKFKRDFGFSLKQKSNYIQSHLVFKFRLE